MNKIGSLESQLMDAFKDKEVQEIKDAVVDEKRIQDKEIKDHVAKVRLSHRQKFNNTWRKKNKNKKKMAKASRRKNR
tara:strand:- start:1065 stop:1295 length:231 start_codon:yes stop_codon:yes gene_type:complete